jgi:hypothetical protein
VIKQAASSAAGSDSLFNLFSSGPEVALKLAIADMLRAEFGCLGPERVAASLRKAAAAIGPRGSGDAEGIERIACLWEDVELLSTCSAAHLAFLNQQLNLYLPGWCE